MRNVKDAYPVCLEIGDHSEKDGRLGFRKAGGRFVQNEQTRVPDEAFANLDELLLGQRQGLDDRLGIMGKPKSLQNTDGRRSEFLPIQEKE
jgi:hypothetical protein